MSDFAVCYGGYREEDEYGRFLLSFSVGMFHNISTHPHMHQYTQQKKPLAHFYSPALLYSVLSLCIKNGKCLIFD